MARPIRHFLFAVHALSQKPSPAHAKGRLSRPLVALASGRS